MNEEQEPIKKELQKFIATPEEKVLLLKRKHIFMLLFPIILSCILAAIFIGISAFIFLYLFDSWISTVLSIGFFVVAALFLMGKSIVEWNFHWYIITNRKVVEVCYVPLSSYWVNDILLDQVKCTEIDIQADGIINELLDMGDINITFDRPTNQEGFFLHDVRGARRLGMFLTNFLLQQSDPSESKATTGGKLAWFKDEKDSIPRHKWRFSEEIFSRTHPT